MPDRKKSEGGTERSSVPLHVSITAAAKRIGFDLREVGLLTMADFDALCRAWVGEKDEKQKVRKATKEDLRKLFPVGRAV